MGNVDHPRELELTGMDLFAAAAQHLGEDRGTADRRSTGPGRIDRADGEVTP
ncbi:hypothetical protein [Streptomyces sp. GESEQ-4]|uniref:hypothetical protein n=1 Tax=Streptomyces sp. GESEQ-4 TaxID=2812655 RepID=UPI001B32A987|nr:hypothetical protein [Streptomyces sp. GESEQ-4]